MILVDTSGWSDDVNGVPTRETDLRDVFLGMAPLLTGDLILAEVLQGFRSDRDFARAKAALDTLAFEPMVGRDIAIAGARNDRKLWALGLPCARPSTSSSRPSASQAATAYSAPTGISR